VKSLRIDIFALNNILPFHLIKEIASSIDNSTALKAFSCLQTKPTRSKHPKQKKEYGETQGQVGEMKTEYYSSNKGTRSTIQRFCLLFYCSCVAL